MIRTASAATTPAEAADATTPAEAARPLHCVAMVSVGRMHKQRGDTQTLCCDAWTELPAAVTDASLQERRANQAVWR